MAVSGTLSRISSTPSISTMNRSWKVSAQQRAQVRAAKLGVKITPLDQRAEYVSQPALATVCRCVRLSRGR